MSTHAPARAVSDAELSDADAIAAVLAGDRGSFAVLVRRHNQTMFRACRAVLRNDHDAEDAVQSAWINVYRALATFRADASFRSWATRIAVNEASSRLRDHRRFTEVPMEKTMIDDSVSPDRAAFSHELARMLEREIDALPEGMRTVLVLRDVIELDTAETAACLGIEIDNVRVRLHRARHALSERLSGSTEELASASAEVWRFDGERCAGILARVMATLATL
jgi:RNA polymerase sigma-70 factor (ECF subfamily)